MKTSKALSMAQKAAKKKKSKQARTGKDPLLMPWQMAPTGSDYSTMLTEMGRFKNKDRKNLSKNKAKPSK
jgi:hypothetical protein